MSEDIAAPASPTAGGSDLVKSERAAILRMLDAKDFEAANLLTNAAIDRDIARNLTTAQQARIREMEERVSRHDKQDAARRKALNSQLVRIRQLKKALKPFAAVANINAQLAANWPDSKPNSEFCPRLWPDWGDFKLAATLSSQTAAEGEQP